MREREDVYGAVVSQAADGIVLLDPETLRFIEFNRAACGGLGYTRREFAALRLTDVQADLSPQEVSERVLGLLRTGGGTFENRHRSKNGEIRDRRVSLRIARIRGRDFMAVIWVDVTERKAREREIERLNRLYAALSDLNRTVLRVSSREELFREVCWIATEKAGFKVGWIGRPDPDTHAVVPVALAGEDKGYIEEIKVYADDRPEGRGAVGTCLREGKPCIFNDFISHPHSTPWRSAIAHGVQAIASLPIYWKGAVWARLRFAPASRTSFKTRKSPCSKKPRRPSPLPWTAWIARPNVSGPRRRCGRQICTTAA